MAATFLPTNDDVVRPGAVEAAPNYVLRRVVAAFVAASLLAAAAVAAGEIVGALSDLGGRPAAASEVSSDGVASVAGAPGIHVAVAGDTLWSIADRYRGEVSRDRYLDALIARNGGSTVIEVGQSVRLP